MTDPNADYTEFVRTRWAALFRTSHLLTGDAAEAEDVLQATLVKVYTQWRRVRRAEAPEAYVRRMLLNEMLSTRRTAARRSGRQHLVPLPAEPVLSDPAERLDLWSRLQALPPRQRAVIVLRYYDDLSEAQIADTLGIAPGTVKSQASAALRALRAGYADPADADEVTR
jgi:RNA polymerase sigma-70 factor (sigma-E family)